MKPLRNTRILDLTRLLPGAVCCFTRVVPPYALLEDPQVKARGLDTELSEAPKHSEHTRQLLDAIGYSSAEIVKLVSRSKSGSQRPAGKHADCKPPFHGRLRELQRRWMAPTDSGGENRPSPLRPRRARGTACSSNNDDLSVSTIAQPTRAHTGTIAAIAMWFLRHWASK